MKLYLSTMLTLVVGLSGCGAMMDSVALYHDQQDPCQGQYASPERKAELGRPADYKHPDYCFRSGRRVYARTHYYNTQGQRTGSAITTVK